VVAISFSFLNNIANPKSGEDDVSMTPSGKTVASASHQLGAKHKEQLHPLTSNVEGMLSDFQTDFSVVKVNVPIVDRSKDNVVLKKFSKIKF
jgi:hypothetical protein